MVWLELVEARTSNEALARHLFDSVVFEIEAGIERFLLNPMGRCRMLVSFQSLVEGFDMCWRGTAAPARHCNTILLDEQSVVANQFLGR